MIEALKKNVIVVTNGTDCFRNLLEYSNCLKLIEELESLDKVFFTTSVFVFNWAKTEDELLKISVESYQRSILLWFAEELNVFPSRGLINKYSVIFKAYLRCEHPEVNVYSFPLVTPSSVPEYEMTDVSKRSFNVFFSGNLNLNRLSLYKYLKPDKTLKEKAVIFLSNFKGGRYVFNWYYSDKTCDLSDTILRYKIMFNNKFYSGLSPEKYARYLADSKIILSPKGFHSPECFRLYEAMRQGCVVITESLPDVPFYRNIPAIQINSWENIKTIIADLLQDEEQLQELSVKARSFYIEHISIEAIAQYIYNKATNGQFETGNQ